MCPTSWALSFGDSSVSSKLFYFEDKYEGKWAEAASSLIIKEDLSVCGGDEESSSQCCLIWEIAKREILYV